jgi:hypothetical protein
MTDQSQKNLVTNEPDHDEGPEQDESVGEDPAKATIDGLQLRKTVESLPESGRTAHVHTVLTRHASEANRMAQNEGRSTPIDLNIFLLHQVVTLDGERVRPGELRDLPWADTQRLMEAAGMMDTEANPLS